MSSTAGRAHDETSFDAAHAPMDDALVAMGLAERLPIGVAHDRRSEPRISTGVAPAPAGQLFLEELSHDERVDRVATSANALDHASRAYRIVEVIRVAGHVVEENVLGEVWLSLRDSDMAGAVADGAPYSCPGQA